MSPATKLECPVCKKKFKNVTSLNYHEMYHTQDERDEANGVSSPAPARRQSYSESDSDSETFKKIKAKKNPQKQKEEAKKIVEVENTEPAKVAHKRFSEASEDSDTTCDSNYLSLKHISMSIKKQDEKRGAKDAALTIAARPTTKLEVKPIPKTEVPPHKNTELKPEPKAKGNFAESSSSKKVKFPCDKCKKKFSDMMAMEYHKITFHVEAPPTPPPRPAPLPTPSVSAKSSKAKTIKNTTSNTKSKKIIESESDSDSESDIQENSTEPELKKYADEKNKLSALSGIFNKKRSFSLVENEPVKKARETKASKDLSRPKPAKDKKVTSAQKPKPKPKPTKKKVTKVQLYSDSDSDESELEEMAPTLALTPKAMPKIIYSDDSESDKNIHPKDLKLKGKLNKDESDESEPEQVLPKANKPMAKLKKGNSDVLQPEKQTVLKQKKGKSKPPKEDSDESEPVKISPFRAIIQNSKNHVEDAYESETDERTPSKKQKLKPILQNKGSDSFEPQKKTSSKILTQKSSSRELTQKAKQLKEDIGKSEQKKKLLKPNTNKLTEDSDSSDEDIKVPPKTQKPKAKPQKEDWDKSKPDKKTPSKVLQPKAKPPKEESEESETEEKSLPNAMKAMPNLQKEVVQES